MTNCKWMRILLKKWRIETCTRWEGNIVGIVIKKHR